MANTVGLALSGGGARGIAHIGVLQALNEMHVFPGMLSGVSSGGIVAALYAAGHTPGEILQMAKQHTSAINAATVLPGGLFSPSGIREILSAAIGGSSFESLHIPLYITATDVLAGVPVTFSTGSLYDVVIGSSSIPGLFNPVKFGDYLLVDGGITDNLPVSCIREHCTHLLGCDVNKIFPAGTSNFTRLQLIDRCFSLGAARTVADNASRCDIVIGPQLGAYGMFDVKQADEIFDIGYRAIMDARSHFLSWIL